VNRGRQVPRGHLGPRDRLVPWARRE
jgi:hypothetical protein